MYEQNEKGLITLSDISFFQESLVIGVYKEVFNYQYIFNY